MIQRRSSFSVLLTILLVISFFASGSVRAGELAYASLEISPGEAAPIKAVVISPDWHNCSSAWFIWDNLNTNWSNYGTTPISIVYDIPDLCSGTITYEALAASDADVLIFSELSQDNQPLTLDEIAAIERYAHEGHNLIGTFVLFQSAVDDRALAPLFGLRADLDYTYDLITPDFDLIYPTSILFRDIVDPLHGSDITSHAPLDLSWDASDLNGAIYMAKTADSKGVITLYSNRDYEAIYSSYRPEYGGGPIDQQFFYNAITYQKTVMAVTVKSYGDCTSLNLLWYDLNLNWASYGSTPILIDYTNPLLCDPVTFTIDDLRASGADVVIISDPSGALNIFSAAEVAALQQYALEGHNVLGTYLLMSWYGFDNRKLAPIFGLRPGIDYAFGVMPILQYSLFEPEHRLFTNLLNPYTTEGYYESQFPIDGSWDPGELNGARMLAATPSRDAAILINYHPVYTSIYITSMPEFNGFPQDEQFLYNALTYPTYHRARFLPLVGSDFSFPP